MNVSKFLINEKSIEWKEKYQKRLKFAIIREVKKGYKVRNRLLNL